MLRVTWRIGLTNTLRLCRIVARELPASELRGHHFEPTMGCAAWPKSIPAPDDPFVAARCDIGGSWTLA